MCASQPLQRSSLDQGLLVLIWTSIYLQVSLHIQLQKNRRHPAHHSLQHSVFSPKGSDSTRVSIVEKITLMLTFLINYNPHHKFSLNSALTYCILTQEYRSQPVTKVPIPSRYNNIMYILFTVESHCPSLAAITRRHCTLNIVFSVTDSICLVQY